MFRKNFKTNDYGAEVRFPEGKRDFSVVRNVQTVSVPPVQLVPKTKLMGVKLTTHRYLVTRVRISGGIHPLVHVDLLSYTE